MIVADTKPYVQRDPLIGYRYVPNTRLTLPRPGGGKYELAINAGGIRSDREYSVTKPKGVCRIVVCGDSMAAGQFVSNAQRFSELLERRIPHLEVVNLALEGSGTDQQVLLYEHVGLQYEHDLVVLLPFLQNIRRNMAGFREAIDPSTGATILRPKPRFELVGGELVLRPAASATEHAATDEPPSITRQLKGRVSRLPGASLLKKIGYALVPWEPFPEYRDPDGPAWQLMAALVSRLKLLASKRPVVVAPLFYSNYVRYRMARNYWDRYSSLSAIDGVHVIDLLPYFKQQKHDAIRCFQDPYDMHFSAYGHVVMADALAMELRRLGLL
jgi:hypothetical protein